MTAPDPQPPAAAETDVSAVVDAIGAELYQSLMEASADEWRRWEFLTDAAKEKYRAEGARIVRSALGPLLADLSAARERVREVEGERDAADVRLHVEWHKAESRAESAEAAHEALRAGVEALADEWEGWAKKRSTPRIDAFRDAAEALRALLAGDAR
jgi:hypothetical protein